MEAFTIHEEDLQGTPVLTVQGYFSDVTGRDLLTRLERLIGTGRTTCIIDLGPCTVINSPGLGTMLDLTLKVVDDLRGRLILTGLDRVKTSVLEMVGVLAMVTVAPDRAAALRQAQTP
ncbi:MAG: hypothetical protein OZSIB_0091 [Candidatus Ozemobacter sibiricus]|jgi:anti-anti-sigma regulatory factor|uniref:STAS domain-containing protein n=1 Tax=Candidatus Ozemobacter sibiricus TaxID=2268124 RepID=A0A367ZQ20_9BACT|nr:MAG: hypothetical protein OZSIB_0091 [Candidatus Ozemobacter sibiricus]